MSNAADDGGAGTAWGFWTAPVGGFVLSLLLSLPDQSTCTLEGCLTYFGFPTVTLSSAQSFGLSALVGAVFWVVFAAFHHVTHRPTPPSV